MADYKDQDDLYREGAEHINISATCVVYKALLKILKGMNTKLAQIQKSGRYINYAHVKKYLVEFLQLELAEFSLYSAFKVDKDEIFYQQRNSEDWQMLDKVTKCYNIENFKKYKSQMTMFKKNLFAAGAGIFKAMDERNIVTQGLTGLGTIAYYGIMRDEAADSFRYWIATNQNNHRAFVKLLNVPSNNKLIKNSQKIVFDSINIDKVLFVPMIAKRFTMQESHEYDGLTDQDIE